MGCVNSKQEKNEALNLCKERKRFIKQAIYSRYALAASHVAYIQSLKNIGIALRRYAEAEILNESSLPTSVNDLDKSPSRRSNNVLDSPLHNESPLTPPLRPRLSYMRTGGSNAVTVRVSPLASTGFGDYDSMAAFSMPPPPPPPDCDFDTSWDYFDTTDNSQSLRNVGHNGFDQKFDPNGGLNGNNEYHEKNTMLPFEQKDLEILNGNGHCSEFLVPKGNSAGVKNNQESVNGEVKPTDTKRDRVLEKSFSKRLKNDDGLCTEREDASEFITHRAKDFLSSIRDIEHRFFRASESGKEVCRLLEAKRIRVGYSEAIGSSPSILKAMCHLDCCRGNNVLVCNEPPQNVTKVITWNRSTSSRSSSSKNPLAATPKDDNDDSGSDFIEEFCMIAGSNSSTLDRLYAWERKLSDEVKASETIRKVYDKKCAQLRHQFAKDFSTQIIDKTRAVVKDLHSRIKVGLHSVNAISRRIEKMRDEELQPQLVELIQGLSRMWKAMLECHHTQYITISLAYHSRSTPRTQQGDSQRQIMAQLYHEIKCFSLSFTDWTNTHIMYIEALNGWLQNCVLQPREHTRSRRPFSPRRVLAPPIFVLCRDWSAGIKSLPSDELSDAIKTLLFDLHHAMVQPAEEASVLNNSEETERKDGEKKGIDASLTKVLDGLNKFSEESLKMYEDVGQKSEMARIAYSNCRPV